MIHIRRGGSNGTTKDKDHRFVPVHPKIAEFMRPAIKNSGPLFTGIEERTLLQRLKTLCEKCKFDDSQQYKLHSFRHHFASLCANHQVAHRKALAWLGYRSSEMLDLYYHLHDEDSQNAMMQLAGVDVGKPAAKNESASLAEGNLKAMRQSTIEKLMQVQEFQELVNCLEKATEREGFNILSFCKLCTKLCLQLNLVKGKELNSLVNLLFLHDFLPSRDGF